MRSALRFVLLAGLLLVLPGAAGGQSYVATITPDQEVPPTPSTASGACNFSLDASKVLSFDITIGGLHGAETSASIHGPASAGVSAGILFTLPVGGTKTGSLGPLTAAQVADLQAGLWYVNIHTSHHASGEIRGQIRGAVAVQPGTWGGIKVLYRIR